MKRSNSEHPDKTRESNIVPDLEGMFLRLMNPKTIRLKQVVGSFLGVKMLNVLKFDGIPSVS